MTTDHTIDIHKALDWMRDNSEKFAEAKANRVLLEEFRKTKKAMLMKQAEHEGVKSSVAQERDAYAHPEYAELLKGLREAVAEEEKLRWLLVSAQARIDVWRSLNASNRFMDRSVL